MIKQFCDVTGEPIVGREFCSERLESWMPSAEWGRGVAASIILGVRNRDGVTTWNGAHVGAKGMVKLLRYLADELEANAH